MSQMRRNSIRSFAIERDYSPFFIGSIVGLTRHVDMNNRAVANLEATGIWVTTDFELRQRAGLDRHRNNMWDQASLDVYNIDTVISVVAEWLPYAYPQEFEPAWEVPNDFHNTFEVGRDLYIMNSIQGHYGSDGYHKYEINIHPLVRLNYAQKVSGDSQDHRTIEH